MKILKKIKSTLETLIGVINFQTPVEFALNYSLVQTKPVMDYGAGGNSNDLPNINEFPILNQAQAKKKFQATFDRDCGDDDICQADIQLSPKLTDKVRLNILPNLCSSSIINNRIVTGRLAPGVSEVGSKGWNLSLGSVEVVWYRRHNVPNP